MIGRAVLVVDDDPGSRSLLHAILSRAGFDVRVAADGTEALGLLGQDAVALMVTDVEMPGLDGIALTRRVKADRPEVKVVVISGAMDERLRDAAILAGADATMQKPFSPNALLTEVDRLLQQG